MAFGAQSVVRCAVEDLPGVEVNQSEPGWSLAGRGGGRCMQGVEVVGVAAVTEVGVVGAGVLGVSAATWPFLVAVVAVASESSA